jgi:hypothetical protein
VVLYLEVIQITIQFLLIKIICLLKIKKLSIKNKKIKKIIHHNLTVNMKIMVNLKIQQMEPKKINNK